MDRPLRVLFVEDDERDVELIHGVLADAGFAPAIHRVEVEADLRQALTHDQWHIALVDYQLPRFSGMAALYLVKQLKPDLPVVLVSGAIGEEAAVEAMREGAHDYVLKGNLRRLPPVVEREITDAALRARFREVETALLEAALESMVVVAPDGLILRTNHRTQETFGHSPDELRGQPFTLLVPTFGPWNGSRPFAPIEPGVRDARRHHGVRKDGTEFPVELTLTPFASGESVAVIAAIRDLDKSPRGERRASAQTAVGHTFAGSK